MDWPWIVPAGGELILKIKKSDKTLRKSILRVMELYTGLSHDGDRHSGGAEAQLKALKSVITDLSEDNFKKIGYSHISATNLLF